MRIRQLILSVLPEKNNGTWFFSGVKNFFQKNFSIKFGIFSINKKKEKQQTININRFFLTVITQRVIVFQKNILEMECLIEKELVEFIRMEKEGFFDTYKMGGKKFNYTIEHHLRCAKWHIENYLFFNGHDYLINYLFFNKHDYLIKYFKSLDSAKYCISEHDCIIYNSMYDYIDRLNKCISVFVNDVHNLETELNNSIDGIFYDKNKYYSNEYYLGKTKLLMKTVREVNCLSVKLNDSKEKMLLNIKSIKTPI